MDTHGVEIFDRTNDDDIVSLVAHHFQFVFLPAENRFFQHNFMDHTGIKAVFGNHGKFFPVVGDPASCPAESKGGADDDRKSDICGDGKDFVHGFGKAAAGHPEANILHGRSELLPVFGLVNHLQGSADHFHAVLFQNTAFGNSHRRVQTRLTANGRQKCIGPFPGNNFRHRLRRDGFHIGPIRHFRVRHDGRRIAVDQHNLITLFLQSLAGLCAGIIELAGLADDNGTGADDQDFFQVISFWHGLVLLPLDGAGRLGTYVIDHAVDTPDLIDDTVGNPAEDLMGQFRPIGRHGIVTGDGPDG